MREDVPGHQWILIPEGSTVVVIPAPDENPNIIKGDE